MAPPRASTRKLTRKPALLEGNVPWVGLIIGVGYSGILQDGEYHCVSELLQIFLEWLKEWWARKKQEQKQEKKKKILLGWLEQWWVRLRFFAARRTSAAVLHCIS